jgi:ABC-type dipeptide/oligopeptide/nickel transport system ATPase component
LSIAAKNETPNILAAALEWYETGASIIPVDMRLTTDKDDAGIFKISKRPLVDWKQYYTTRANEDQIIAWFENSTNGIGLVTGYNSIEMLECERRAIDTGLHKEAAKLAAKADIVELWNLFYTSYVEDSASGGRHWIYRIDDNPVPGNKVFAHDKDGQVLFESRGLGGFTIISPSQAVDGRAWKTIKGHPSTIPTLTWAQREQIVSIFKTFDRKPVKDVIGIRSTPKPLPAGQLRPGDDYNAKGSWRQLLEPLGWTKAYSSRGTHYLIRPGKNDGISATIRDESRCLYVFSSNAQPFETEIPYSLFGALALLNFNSDFKATARKLAQDGYGSNITYINEAADPVEHLAVDPDTGEILQHSSWYPKPLDLSDTNDEPEPQFLARDDGKHLFYRGKVNGIIGESESGKSWIALATVAQAIATGNKVAYIDFEDSMRSIRNRIDSQLSLVTYANPDEALGWQTSAEFYSAIADQGPDLIIVDGVNAAMTLMGLNLVDNADATKFSQTILKPLTKNDVCVITVDHVTKSKENRGNNAIGAQAKRADISGASYIVTVVAPFGRGLRGELRMSVAKDRPGHVRAFAQEAKFVGSAILNSDALTGQVRFQVRPAMAHDDFRPTHYMEKISRLLEASTEAMSKNAIEKAVGGKAETVRQAAQMLINEGYLFISNGARNSVLCKLERKYREVDDPKSDIYIDIDDKEI